VLRHPAWCTIESMETAPSPSGADLAAWEQIQFAGDLSPTQARALLKLHFSPQDMDRMRALSAKARAGTLAPDEAAQIDAFERLGCMLDILHSKARRVLHQRRSVS
jgi:hypothetical protein